MQRKPEIALCLFEEGFGCHGVIMLYHPLFPRLSRVWNSCMQQVSSLLRAKCIDLEGTESIIGVQYQNTQTSLPYYSENLDLWLNAATPNTLINP